MIVQLNTNDVLEVFVSSISFLHFFPVLFCSCLYRYLCNLTLSILSWKRQACFALALLRGQNNACIIKVRKVHFNWDWRFMEWIVKQTSNVEQWSNGNWLTIVQINMNGCSTVILLKPEQECWLLCDFCSRCACLLSKFYTRPQWRRSIFLLLFHRRVAFVPCQCII